MAQINLTQLIELATKSKRFEIEKNNHDGSIAIIRKNHETQQIIEGVRCYISGQCLDLTWNLSPPLSLHEAGQLLHLVT